LDTDSLVDAARRGDAPAYLALVRPHHADALRLATVITGSRADAEDVVQEALVKAHAAMDRFRPGSPFRPWLLRVVANEAKNRRRAGHRRAAATERYARLAVVGSAGEAPDPEALALARVRAEALWRAVGALDERDRLVLAYRYFADLSEAETAEALGCRPGTVKSRLSRALSRLRDRLDADVDGDVDSAGDGGGGTVG
jgi:RNA polymerase sigma-70 factor (ECF subfamily)